MNLLNKYVKINVVSLIALLVIIVCVGLIVSVVYSYGENECIVDPVAYANNNSNNYWWDVVYAVRYDMKTLG